MFEFPFWDFRGLIWAFGSKARNFAVSTISLVAGIVYKRSDSNYHFQLVDILTYIHPKTMNFALDNSRVEDERPKRCTRSDVESVGRLDSENPSWKNLRFEKQVVWGWVQHDRWGPIHLAWMIPLIYRYGCALIRYWIEVYFLPWKSQNYQETKKNRIAADSTGICWRLQVGLSFNKNWWNRITVLLLINGEVLGKIRGW